MVTNRMYEAAFKKPKSGKLWWLSCEAETEQQASTKMQEHASNPKSNYLLYGGPFLVKTDKQNIL